MQTCSVCGCDEPVKARSLCRKHYRRLLATGSTDLIRSPTLYMTLEERIAYYSTPAPNGCIEWRGSKDRDGYGQINGRRAHRAAYELINGPIPDGMVVLHSCDNPSCINPKHMKIGTQRDNVHDMLNKGRRHSSKGARNSSAKLSEKDVLAIRNDPRILRDIAKDYGISISLASQIRLRQAWSHL